MDRRVRWISFAGSAGMAPITWISGIEAGARGALRKVGESWLRRYDYVSANGEGGPTRAGRKGGVIGGFLGPGCLGGGGYPNTVNRLPVRAGSNGRVWAIWISGQARVS